MKIGRLLIRDIRSGALTKWYLVFLPIAFGVCRGIQCASIIDSMIDDGQMYTYGTVIDYIMFAMQGMSVYKFNPTEYFSIPIYWFIFQMGAFYIVAYYAFDDFKKNGRAVFVALGERKSWWLAKCLWCNIMVLFYFVVAYISVAVMAYDTCGYYIGVIYTAIYCDISIGSNADDAEFFDRSCDKFRSYVFGICYISLLYSVVFVWKLYDVDTKLVCR